MFGFGSVCGYMLPHSLCGLDALLVEEREAGLAGTFNIQIYSYYILFAVSLHHF